jgi:RNA recognition motif-containing protein
LLYRREGKEKRTMKVFMGNLDWHATDDDVRRYAEGRGFGVERVSVAVDGRSGRSRGFAFVELSGSGDAVAALDGGEILGRTVRAEIPRNLVTARKLVVRAQRGNPKAVRQVRVYQAAAKSGNPNAKRAVQRLRLAASLEKAVAAAKAKLATGTASREELLAGAKAARAMGDDVRRESKPRRKEGREGGRGRDAEESW